MTSQTLQFVDKNSLILGVTIQGSHGYGLCRLIHLFHTKSGGIIILLEISVRYTLPLMNFWTLEKETFTNNFS